jgi:hypothetical protein
MSDSVAQSYAILLAALVKIVNEPDGPPGRADNAYNAGVADAMDWCAKVALKAIIDSGFPTE